MIELSTRFSASAQLDQNFDRFAERIKQQKMLAGVAAAAEVIYDEVRFNAARGGPRFPDVQTTKLVNSIYRAYIPERSTGDQRVYIVTWRRRDAPHGGFLEFGTSRAPAQPFVRPAAARLPEALARGKARMQEGGA